MEDNNSGPGCVVMLFVLVIVIYGTCDFIVNDKPPEQPVAQQPVEQPKVEVKQDSCIEGVVTRLIPGPRDITTVIFDSGEQYDLNLGDHKIYVGEWNQLRVDNGVVHDCKRKGD